MVTYRYDCENVGDEFEILCKFSLEVHHHLLYEKDFISGGENSKIGWLVHPQNISKHIDTVTS